MRRKKKTSATQLGSITYFLITTFTSFTSMLCFKRNPNNKYQQHSFFNAFGNESNIERFPQMRELCLWSLYSFLAMSCGVVLLLLVLLSTIELQPAGRKPGCVFLQTSDLDSGQKPKASDKRVTHACTRAPWEPITILIDTSILAWGVISESQHIPLYFQPQEIIAHSPLILSRQIEVGELQTVLKEGDSQGSLCAT